MLPYFSDCFGNASSGNHAFGWEAETAVNTAREQIASAIGAKSGEILFTSGATESDNMALRGVAFALRAKGNHIITSNIEHKAVLDTCKVLESEGFEITYLEVDNRGLIDPEQVKSAFREATILVSIMHSNNEIGVLQDLKEIGRLCHDKQVFFHTDAAQSLGKIAFDVESFNLDLASFSAHKMYGPKGVGALYFKNNPTLQLQPISYGGGQEKGVRSGTLNVPAIVGFGKACLIATAELEDESRRILALREKLRAGLLSKVSGISVNGDSENRLPGNLNISISDVPGPALLLGLQPEIAISSGSACSTHSSEGSHVLKAIGCQNHRVENSIRFGIGRFNDEKEIDHAIDTIAELVKQLRGN
jgi:cysteine desulfurase